MQVIVFFCHSGNDATAEFVLQKIPVIYDDFGVLLLECKNRALCAAVSTVRPAKNVM